jgi:hypothetical protein
MLPFGDNLKTPSKPGEAKGSGGTNVGSGLPEHGGNFYCRLRMYNSLKQGKFSVRARKTVYTPFKLRVDFREIGACTASSLGGGHSSDEGSRSPDSQSIEAAAAAATGVEAGLQSVCLIITAVPVVSAYSEPDQVNPFGATFITRHNATCSFTKVRLAHFKPV